MCKFHQNSWQAIASCRVFLLHKGEYVVGLYIACELSKLSIGEEGNKQREREILFSLELPMCPMLLSKGIMKSKSNNNKIVYRLFILCTPYSLKRRVHIIN